MKWAISFAAPSLVAPTASKHLTSGAFMFFYALTDS
jgi:hypothetical protein